MFQFLSFDYVRLHAYKLSTATNPLNDEIQIQPMNFIIRIDSY